MVVKYKLSDLARDLGVSNKQIIDLLANGVTHIHVYTMNKPDIAAAILNNLSEILKV